MPKISIITPCFNSEKYIGRTIKSVQAQTLPDWEYVVVDDGSTDGSAAVVEGFAQQEPRLRLATQANGGVGRARNYGYAAAAPGEYLLFLDADDCLEPSMLETLAGYLDTHPEVGLVYCKPLCIDTEDKRYEEPDFAFGPRRVPRGMRLGELPDTEAETPFLSIFTICCLLPSVALIRRSVYAETGGWDEELGHIYEDTDLFLRIALRSQVHYLPEHLLRYRRHPAQATSQEAGREREAVQQAKLYAKWNQISALPAAQQAKLDQARAFREGVVVPFSGFQAGTACLRRGDWKGAVRFYGGAVKRYAPYLLNPVRLDYR